MSLNSGEALKLNQINSFTERFGKVLAETFSFPHAQANQKAQSLPIGQPSKALPESFFA
jgi:hypothetical protein